MSLQRSTISDRLIGMGDSHLDNFSFFCAATCRIPGATAYGLLNVVSDTFAGSAFFKFLSAFPKHYIPLLCIGEVDCNSLPWRLKTEKAPSQFIHKSVNNLFLFLEQMNRKFILPSVTLPPVDSYIGSGNRLHVTSSREERTALVNLYNGLLKAVSIKTGHYYLDITTSTTGPNGLVNQAFIRSPNDVHLVPAKIHTIIRDLLDKVTL